MNILDRAIEYFAPRTGLRRAEARSVLEQVRSYESARLGRRTDGWSATNGSANALTKGKLPLIRARSRELVRNTWWGPRVVSVFTAHAVGTGITPVSKTGNRALDKKVAKLWREWGCRCDAEGQLDINGLIALACRTIVESGEVLGRKIVRSSPGGSRVPLEIMLLEPDHLDGSRDKVGNETVTDQGIEYGRDGKRSAYWLLPDHPGAKTLLGRRESVKVDAGEILHVYRKDRVGQGRGVPWLSPIALKGRDLADLEDAIIVKAKVEACFAAYVKTNDTARTLGQAQTEQRGDGRKRRIESLAPAMVTYLEQGEEMGAVTPSSSLAFDAVLINTWMALAAGAGLTYDQLTGDLRQANYSSLRAGKIEFRRLVEQFQWLTLVPMLLDPLWQAFTEAAQDFGALPRRVGGYPVEWIMPAVEPIDPLKDLQADILAVRAGRMTWPQFVASWGFEPEDQLDEIERWQKDIDRRGIVLDADPRRGLKGVKGAPPTDATDADPSSSKDTTDEQAD